MYIMGNMENLIQSSEIWPKIKEVLVAQESIGQHLELRCKVSALHLKYKRESRLHICTRIHVYAQGWFL
jgi:hypothetical protein